MGINLFLFTFMDKKEVLEILKKGPWFVMGHILSLQSWVPQASVYELDFNKVSFLVQLHGFPLDMMNTKNAAKIMNHIGEVQEVENPEAEGRLLRTFIRVRALIDKNPLTTGCWVPRKDLPNVWIIIRYEKLQSLCFNCGIIGHEQKSCSRDKVMSTIDRRIPKYSAKVGVPPAKSILSLTQEQGFWKKREDHQGFSNSTDQREEDGSQQNKGKRIVMPGSPVVGKNVAICNKENPHAQQVQGSDVAGSSEFATKGPHMSPTILSNVEEGAGVIPKALPIGPLHSFLTDGNESPPVTKVDLMEKKVRPSLGPDNLELLGLATEFIGLQKDPVILDYPSPTNTRYQGAALDLVQVRKCRNFISKQAGQKKKGDLGYTVEFPEDEEDNYTSLVPVQLQQDEESQLIVGWNNSLSLKRYRKDAFVDSGDFFDDLWQQGKKIKTLDDEDQSIRDEAKLQELIRGCRFTWYSNPRNGFVTREKLDRILVNWSWRELFPNALAMAIPSVSSNHTPLILWPKPKMKSGCNFKFEAFWEEHEDCNSVIQEGWTDRSQESQGWDSFLKKAKNYKATLQNWHNKTFRRADHQILKLNEELKLLLNSTTLEFGDNWGRIQELRKNIDMLRKQEDIYWAQRSRLKWLNYGDKNSKFFHASTIQRRDRNKLYRLKDSEGNWIEG
ncbi:Zinc finger, CCHC-type [Sesbania bispinosa]|nr:Zinc finger, CCHC-type [Sesbania bispinosa]